MMMKKNISDALEELKNLNHSAAFNALLIEKYIKELLLTIKTLKEDENCY